MSAPGHETALPWLRTGTAAVRAAVAGLDDAAAREPSALPGWTRGHVVTHLARNADALVNLLTWARTGEERPMYASPEQRTADIEEGAGRPAGILAKDLDAAGDRLDAALAALPGAAWEAPVRTAQGRTVAASVVPWMRVRELWIHAVDLRAGVALGDLPPDLVDALLDEVTATFTARGGAPAVVLAPMDRDRTWRIGVDDGVATLRAPAADLLGWLTGRAPLDGAPAVPPWL
ncbi:maleylpyruvate isomerase family mycothiol-dependent enzyme [Phytohabitans kaempferiae]|uniref:Maleylpyruvate isomerase family mycothiol-dependent enzyme n=1 Tax=Phytohabitans kaempferiae TaxID=1620943 RepID=A0ABV6LZH4_9ACTN